jgi:DNA-binding CsgD family transcriptional regulator
MSICDNWTAIAPLVTENYVTRNGNDQAVKRDLDSITAVMGCHLVVQRMDDLEPAYISPSVGAIIGSTVQNLGTLELLQFFSKQTAEFVLAWHHFLQHMTSGLLKPALSAFSITDHANNHYWLGGCYGNLGIDSRNQQVAMAVFYNLNQLGTLNASTSASQTMQVMLQGQLGLLSNRERDVLRMLLADYTAPEVAVMLHISTNTVQSHRKNILIKLKSRSLIGLAMFKPLLTDI